MHKFQITGLMLLAALGLAACQESEQAATTAKSAVQAQSTATLSTTDATFINTVGMGGNAEVTFGQLAQSKATRADIRQFAGQMVTDHGAANQKLIALAQQKGMTAPSGMDTMHQQLYAQLQGMTGTAFDDAYMKGQVQDHEATVQALQTEIQNGSDADVKAFAQEVLPTVQHHLDMAHSITGM
jgi:putative membrane protein